MHLRRSRTWTAWLAVVGLAAGTIVPAVGQNVADTGAEPRFPQQRTVDGYALLIHAPQVRSWPGFERFTSEIAFELTPAGQPSPKYGTATVAGDTTVDMTKRIVTVRSPKVTGVKFAGPATPGETAAIEHSVRRSEFEVPVDLFVAYLADDVLVGSTPAGFNTEPPPIVVRSKPTLLLFVNGSPVPSPVPNTNLEVIVNSNWPTYRDQTLGAYYVLDRDRWLTSSALDGGWKVAGSLPAGFSSLPAADEYAAARAAIPPKSSSRVVPQVMYASRPTELVVTEGAPSLEAIPGADGLQWVKNTESPLFKLVADWYYLVAGRWFRTTNLDNGPWNFVSDLPASFGDIPADHPRAAVRASVPGTVEAKMAALEASIPTKTTVRKGAAPTVEVTYAGEPRFEAIAGTQVARAVNSGFDVFLVENRYYLCYSAAWYVSISPTGPWGATADVPAAIYSIPPNSPSYTVTNVTVTESEDDEIEYSSTAAYATGMFVAMGVAYYGTGWYYPPYIYGGYYYPYWGSYGHGSWYNPATGRYGSRSVWYGPYGGYSYTQGYNPRTGRYGYVETAWDGDEWGSYGETYNPRTGIGTETERHYNEDKNKLKTERTVERGDQSIKTEKTVDFDDGTRTVERETSGGQSMTSTTKREDGRSATAIEGSGGGQAISVSGEGPGRTTIARSGSGDLYAGHDGNVYKKTDDGWQQYDNGQWTQRDPIQPRSQQPSSTERPATTRPASQPSTTRSPSQLDRDHAARHRGNAQFHQRAGGMRMGGRRR